MIDGRSRPGGLVLLSIVVAAVMAALLFLAVTTRPDPAEPAAGDTTVTPLAVTDGYALWARRTDGTAVRWNPCGTITWVLNPDGAPENAQDLVARAFERITAVTGLDSRFVGTTDEVPAVDRSPYQPDRYPDAWAPVLVAWVSPHTGGLPLRDSDRAISIPVAVNGTFVSGQVTLNVDQRLAPDFADRATSWGATLVHEVGHLVGLDHVDDPDQMMYRFPGEGLIRFGAGDLAGLSQVGRAAGGGDCLDAGRPRRVDVTVAPRR